jgi:hypothetical protein
VHRTQPGLFAANSQKNTFFRLTYAVRGLPEAAGDMTAAGPYTANAASVGLAMSYSLTDWLEAL